MKIEQNEVIFTNREYFSKFCYKNDLCRINRMWLKHLDSTCGREAPLWEKENEYDKWLDMDFNRDEWNSAKIKEEKKKSGMLLSMTQISGMRRVRKFV